MVETVICCAACQLPIMDKYLLNVLDKPWHLDCVRCVDCLSPQNESCFFRDGLILCREDFERRYAIRCAACNLLLEKQELVRKARDCFYHCRCFRCTICQRPLDTGEQLYIVDGYKFVCREDFVSSQILACSTANSSNAATVFAHQVSDDCLTDYEEEVDIDENQACTTAMSNASTNSGNDENLKFGTGDDNLSSIQKRRGPRTTIKAKQLDILKAAFASMPKPTRHIREQLAAETGLNMRVIQVWYQNRRSKERRLKQMRANGTYRTSRRQRSSSSTIHSDDQLIDTNGNMPSYLEGPASSLTENQYYSTAPLNSTPSNPIFPSSSDLYANQAPLDQIEEFVGAQTNLVQSAPTFWSSIQQANTSNFSTFDSDYHVQRPAIR